jgi:hypothetical protein
MDSTLANAEDEVKVIGGAVPDTRISEMVAMVTAGIKNKPTTVSDALTLLEHLALKHIEPFIDSLREWALSEVEEGERKLAEIALKSVQMEKKD